MSTHELNVSQRFQRERVVVRSDFLVMGLLGFSDGPTGIHVWSAEVRFATLLNEMVLFRRRSAKKRVSAVLDECRERRDGAVGPLGVRWMQSERFQNHNCN